MKKNMLLFTSLLIPLSVFAADWDYDNEQNWGNIAAACEQGMMQSPIDIQSNFLVSKMPKIDFFYDVVALNVVNNGHTLQVNNKEANYFSVNGKDYQLLQLHFHTPSEYTIDNEKFPLEAHFVHQDSEGALGVIGVMMKVGNANTEIDKILKIAPSKIDVKTAENSIDLAKLLPADQHYYRFMGSLTTPPCSEGVNWFIMRSSIDISQKQLEQFQLIMSNNARSLQQQNNRLIVSEE